MTRFIKKHINEVQKKTLTHLELYNNENSTK